MKRKYTQAREANRASEYHKTGGHGLRSKNRSLLRDKPKPKTFGESIRYLQPVFKGHSRLGNPRFVFIPHAFNYPLKHNRKWKSQSSTTRSQHPTTHRSRGGLASAPSTSTPTGASA